MKSGRVTAQKLSIAKSEGKETGDDVQIPASDMISDCELGDWRKLKLKMILSRGREIQIQIKRKTVKLSQDIHCNSSLYHHTSLIFSSPLA
jgi:hypothetical protein